MQNVLVLGATGRFGRHAAAAFANAGWAVKRFNRKADDLDDAARGKDVIVNGWNPLYPDWADMLPKLHRKVIDAAAISGSTVIVPGNVYVFGPQMPFPWSAATPHQATNPLGRLRVEMEEVYRASSVRTILLRAGDFIDTAPSGNWFDQIMIKNLDRGRFVYPGRNDIPHSWAFLPDLARAAVALAEMRHTLPRYSDIPFEGFTLSGAQLAQGLERATGMPVSVRSMAWWPIRAARPFWALAPHLLEMRYLWDTPHSLDGTYFNTVLPEFQATEQDVALRQAIAAFGLNGSDATEISQKLVKS